MFLGYPEAQYICFYANISVKIPGITYALYQCSQGFLIYFYPMKITLQISFLKFYVMGPADIHLHGIAHVKVDFIPLQEMNVMFKLKEYVGTELLANFASLKNFSRTEMVDLPKIAKSLVNFREQADGRR